MALSILAVVFAVLLLVVMSSQWVISASRRRQFYLEHHCEPAKSSGWDIFLGIDSIINTKRASEQKRILSLNNKNHDRYGGTYFCKRLWSTQFIVADPENFRAVLNSRFGDFDAGSRRAQALKPAVGVESTFTTDGARWRHARSLLRPGLAQKQAVDLDALELHWNKMLLNIPRDGSTIDIQNLFFRFVKTMDSTTQFLFGSSLGCLEAGVQPQEYLDFVKSFETVLGSAFRRALLGSLHFLDMAYDASKERHASETVRKFTDAIIKNAMENYKAKNGSSPENEIEKHKLLFETLMETMDPSAMRDHTLTVLTGARDTTAAFLSQLWFELSRRPSIFSVLKHEVESTLEGQIPTANMLKKLPYLDFVMKETLRLYPPIPFTMRVANKDTVLPRGGGRSGTSPIFIRKGHEIMLSFNALHRCKDIWGLDADEFKPDRWATVQPGWSYLPFSAGPRICIGQRRALTECAYLTVRLLQSILRIESRDDRPFEESLRVTLTNSHGVMVGLFLD